MLWITWITLTVVFFYFAFVYWRYSTSPMRSFIFRNIEEAQQVEGGESVLPEEFRRDLEGFLASIDKTNKTRYRVAAAGFLIAGINALANLFLF